MQFDLTEEEVHLRQAVLELGGSAFGGVAAPEAVLADWQSPWEKLVAMGLVGLLVPEDLGGSGGTVLDASLVAEALGARDAWVPFVGSAIVGAAHLSIDPGANAEALTRLAEGVPHSLLVDDRLAAAAEPARHLFDWRPGAVGVTTTGSRFSAESAVATGVDLLHPVGRLDAPVGSGDEADPVRALRARACSQVGLAAWLTGVAQAALDEAVSYAGIRQQFGKPIGSFQAIQHLCAEMYYDVETSRSITYGAAWSVDHETPEVHQRAARAARVWSARAAVRVCETSIQVLGGIGVTEEHRAHLRLRNAHQFARAVVDPARSQRDAGWDRLRAGGNDGSR